MNYWNSCIEKRCGPSASYGANPKQTRCGAGGPCCGEYQACLARPTGAVARGSDRGAPTERRHLRGRHGEASRQEDSLYDFRKSRDQSWLQGGPRRPRQEREEGLRRCSGRRCARGPPDRRRVRRRAAARPADPAVSGRAATQSASASRCRGLGRRSTRRGSAAIARARGPTGPSRACPDSPPGIGRPGGRVPHGSAESGPPRS